MYPLSTSLEALHEAGGPGRRDPVEELEQRERTVLAGADLVRPMLAEQLARIAGMDCTSDHLPRLQTSTGLCVVDKQSTLSLQCILRISAS